MFSKHLDVEEGLKQLASIDYIIDLKNFDEDIKNINDILCVKLKPIHTRKNMAKKEIDLEEVFQPIKSKMEPELEFYAKALEYKSVL
ncbi:hypothetical protein [Gracilimonas mengyeensis]|uniref:Uncharacterized protein n=1 Tax=Gracilimonas mengyeensis TaxID=1302730 RepID=A0A521FKY5_9BACT|nr:hypothetical protein [Gracilimonas mengyeensis]SMO96714.1 hypothetical protein SAMN06265219_12133 [Gracilimonas mengyeensis]